MANFAENLANAEKNLGIHPGGPNKLDPIAFKVGDHENQAGQNLGSLKILWYATQRNLTVGEVLPLFAEHLDAVVQNPDGMDHANIRALMKIDKTAYVDSVVVFRGDPIEAKGELERIIDTAWEDRTGLSVTTQGGIRDAVNSIITQLDQGELRVAERQSDGQWMVHQWVKKAVLLSFKPNDNVEQRAGNLGFWDKVPTKFSQWSPEQFAHAGLRVVPPAVARRGSYIAKGAILMPSYVNIGAYVDENTMVDTWATVGSCAQIGKRVHLSGGVGIGGVLEPLQANPTIIEDDCFIGARSEVVEGVIVRQGSVIGMGCYIGQTTPIVNRLTGEVTYGEIPPFSVVIPGNMPMTSALPGLTKYCVTIIKQVDAGTRAKTSLNDLLRD